MPTEKGGGVQGGSLLQGLQGMAGQIQEAINQLQGVLEQLGGPPQSDSQQGQGEQDGNEQDEGGEGKQGARPRGK